MMSRELGPRLELGRVVVLGRFRVLVPVVGVLVPVPVPMMVSEASASRLDEFRVDQPFAKYVVPSK